MIPVVAAQRYTTHAAAAEQRDEAYVLVKRRWRRFTRRLPRQRLFSFSDVGPGNMDPDTLCS
eukprot:10431719-Prorocentrum_lima.AAC.1